MGRNMYAATNIRTDRNNTGHEAVFLHQFIMKPPPGMVVDHIHGYTLDNRRESLRVCTNAENSRNRQKHALQNPSSRYKGVVWHKASKRWRAQYRIGGAINAHAGHWMTEDAAALAYNLAVKRHYGAYARPNALDKTRDEIIKAEIDATTRKREAHRKILAYLQEEASEASENPQKIYINFSGDDSIVGRTTEAVGLQHLAACSDLVKPPNSSSNVRF
jgi:hypothetical protein